MRRGDHSGRLFALNQVIFLIENRWLLGLNRIQNTIKVRTITEEEFPAWERAAALGFGEHTTEARQLQIRGTTEIDRTIGAFDGDRVVGTTSAHTFTMSVPGGAVPLAYVDWVAVLPTHRRNGILTRMTKRQLSDFHERGEPLAGLTATESSIYERFGYGIASWIENWSIRREHTGMTGPASATVETRFVSPQEAREIGPVIYDRVRRERSGMFDYNGQWWDAFASDPEHWREGGSELFHVVHDGYGGPGGLVSYRIRDRSEVVVLLLLGATPKVESALWRHCFGIELMDSIVASSRPIDDPLPWMLTEPRRLERSVQDGLWLRLVDVQKALSSRSYASECRVVIQVHDPMCLWNEKRIEVETSPDGVSCKPTSRSPDLEISVSDLASIYLGGTTLSTLGRAGRIEEHTRGSLKTLDRAFATERFPWTVEF
jgi:predicted acetyltransferase